MRIAVAVPLRAGTAPVKVHSEGATAVPDRLQNHRLTKRFVPGTAGTISALRPLRKTITRLQGPGMSLLQKSARPGALALLAATASAAAVAADDSPAAAQPADAAAFTYSGYRGAFHTNLAGVDVVTSGIADRVFDTQQSGFTLQLAAINVGDQPKTGCGAFLNPTAGRGAGLIAPYSLYGQRHPVDVTPA